MRRTVNRKRNTKHFLYECSAYVCIKHQIVGLWAAAHSLMKILRCINKSGIFHEGEASSTTDTYGLNAQRLYYSTTSYTYIAVWRESVHFEPFKMFLGAATSNYLPGPFP